MKAQKWLINLDGRARDMVEAIWRPTFSYFRVYYNKDRVPDQLNKLALSKSIWCHFERDGHLFVIRPKIIDHGNQGLEVVGFELLIDDYVVPTDREYKVLPRAEHETEHQTSRREPVLQLTDAHRQQFRAKLLACPSISDPSSRATVINQLPGRLREMVRRDARSDVDVQNLVDACVSYKGGLDALLDTVRSFDEGNGALDELEQFVHSLHRQ